MQRQHHNIMFRFLLLISLIVSAFAGCSFPLPSSNFTLAGYSGEWFEIGKVQTAGGAFWEKDCVCTELNIAISNTNNGDGIADNDCRDKTVTGPWTNVTGTLTKMNPPGKWLETIYGNSVNYTVISMGVDYAVEYDCGTSSLGITNYCIHIMSRTRTMDPSLFKTLLSDAEKQGLNPQNLAIQYTTQSGC